MFLHSVFFAFLQQSHASVQQKPRGVWDKNKKVSTKKCFHRKNKNESKYIFSAPSTPGMSQTSASFTALKGRSKNDKTSSEPWGFLTSSPCNHVRSSVATIPAAGALRGFWKTTAGNWEIAYCYRLKNRLKQTNQPTSPIRATTSNQLNQRNNKILMLHIYWLFQQFNHTSVTKQCSARECMERSCYWMRLAEPKRGHQRR